MNKVLNDLVTSKRVQYMHMEYKHFVKQEEESKENLRSFQPRWEGNTDGL